MRSLRRLDSVPPGGATGLLLPNPTASRRSSATPSSIRRTATAKARASLRVCAATASPCPGPWASIRNSVIAGRAARNAATCCKDFSPLASGVACPGSNATAQGTTNRPFSIVNSALSAAITACFAGAAAGFWVGGALAQPDHRHRQTSRGRYRIAALSPDRRRIPTTAGSPSRTCAQDATMTPPCVLRLPPNSAAFPRCSSACCRCCHRLPPSTAMPVNARRWW